jgi:hypothetical protein
LEDGTQGNYTIKSNSNFKKHELKEANKIKILEWKDNADNSGIESVKFVEDRPSNPSNKSNKSTNSIPKSEYCIDRTSIFEQLPKGQTIQCEIHRDKKSVSGMTEYHVLLQETKEHILTARK